MIYVNIDYEAPYYTISEFTTIVRSHLTTKVSSNDFLKKGFDHD